MTTAPSVRAVVAICDPCRPPRPSPDLLSRMFGLTAAEADLAGAIVRGTMLADFAEDRGMSVYTARSHFRRIKRKLGAPDKAAAVRILLCAGLIE